VTTSGSPQAPHDVGAARPGRITVVLLVLLVVATGAGLAVAGAATMPADVPHEAELTCTEHSPASMVFAGCASRTVTTSLLRR